MINCLSSDCTFNEFGTCNCTVVNIEGFEACITPETYCKSFIKDSNHSSFNNSVNPYNASNQNIICSANNCMFNFSGSCKSSSIQVNHSNNSCETFKKREANYQY